jgi:hypothetical protein
MGTIKGLVLLSRVEFLDNNFGQEKYKSFLKQISTPDENFERRPIDGSKNYPELTLLKIDEILLKDYFKNDINMFFQLGEWYAERQMPKFFNLYIDEQDSGEFLFQYNRLRPFLIGSGNIQVNLIKKNSFEIIIDYEQTIPRSICMSEQGFISKGIEICGGRNLEIIEKECASSPPDFICKYIIKFK